MLMIWHTTKLNTKTKPLTSMKLLTSLFAIAISLTVSASPVRADETKTIVEIAAGNPDFSTLVAAVKAAGLAETLSGDGPFTVFAPTNAAFDKLPKGTVEELLKPENKAKLAGILTYHVVGAKVLAKDVKAGAVKTVNGAEAKITVEGGAVKIDAATVTKTDIVGKNGVIHVIDSVILPAAK
jgi:uncharacterized surface protein with fasciclin (FAS1) repeats